MVKMEHRRRSGRAVEETFVLGLGDGGRGAKVSLLEEHPLWKAGVGGRDGVAGEEGEETARPPPGMEGGTFKLGLSEKERRDREGVVLPYYDAQRRGEGVEGRGGDEAERGGEGGRIIYEMGAEDDFDEEEDEI